MKKIKLLVIGILLSLLLASCAAESPGMDETDIYGKLTYDFVTMSYTNRTSYDMLHQMGNAFEDFAILHEDVLDTPLSTADSILYENLLSKLQSLSKRSSTHMVTIISYSSQELKEAFEANGITMTIDDIVSFSALKSLIDEIKTTLDETKSIIRKVDYIGYYTKTELTENDVRDLDTLQTVYQELHQVNPDFKLYEHRFDEFLDELESAGITLDEKNQGEVERAYGFIVILKYKTPLE